MQEARLRCPGHVSDLRAGQAGDGKSGRASPLDCGRRGSGRAELPGRLTEASTARQPPPRSPPAWTWRIPRIPGSFLPHRRCGLGERNAARKSRPGRPCRPPALGPAALFQARRAPCSLPELPVSAGAGVAPSFAVAWEKRAGRSLDRSSQGLPGPVAPGSKQGGSSAPGT